MKQFFAILLLCASVTGYGQDVGCGHPHACNYDADAIHDFGLCWFFCNVGCTSPYSCMYASENYYDDGSCTDVGCEFNYYACDFVVCDFDYGVPVYGCTDCAAFNYNPCATDDDGSCEPITIGCPMPFACNYDVAANTLGYCDFWSCYQGCLDETACNYDPEALSDDGSCYFPEEGCDCDGGCCCPEDCNYPACLSDDNDGICDCLGVTGCVDPSACNYNPMATEPDGSCFYDSCFGCTDESACNYDAAAVLDDFTCEYPEIIGGCGYCGGMLLTEYDCNGDGLCDLSYDIFGCIDESACNYESCATMSVTDDGGVWECFYPEFGYNCEGACLSDVDGDGVCDALEIEGCMDSEACNYDSLATDDDSSCHFDCQFCLEGTVWSEELGGCVVANVSDTDFDGCVGINDFLVHLSNFGSGCGPEPAWACGDPLEYQGYDYETVQIGEQCWFAENLRALNYSNGEEIQTGFSSEQWVGTNDGVYAIYGQDYCTDFNPILDACDTLVSFSEYGALYNWFVLAQNSSVCPTDWHCSSSLDWDNLISYLGGIGFSGVEGDALRTGSGWIYGMNGLDAVGFNGKASGYRSFEDGSFAGSGLAAHWWTPESGNNDNLKAKSYWVNYNNSPIYNTESHKRHGYSIRCIKDPE